MSLCPDLRKLKTELGNLAQLKQARSGATVPEGPYPEAGISGPRRPQSWFVTGVQLVPLPLSCGNSRVADNLSVCL